ncbi:MAG: hypothetical protein QXR53_03480 [Candidatus Norongarragalinales archaeon]
MKVMKESRKGQAALEYLVTYGWAVLAIVIIAAVLWYLGVFNPNRYAAGKQSGGFSTLTVIDYTTTAPTTAEVVFGNAAGTTMNSISVTIDGVAATCNPSTGVAANSKFSCSVTSGASFAVGDQVPVTVGYISQLSGLAHNETGFVRVV